MRCSTHTCKTGNGQRVHLATPICVQVPIKLIMPVKDLTGLDGLLENFEIHFREGSCHLGDATLKQCTVSDSLGPLPHFRGNVCLAISMNLLKEKLIAHEVVILPIASNDSLGPLMNITSNWADIPIANWAKMVTTFALQQSGVVMTTTFSKTY